MSVLRKDPLSHGWVIFAEERYRPPAVVENVVVESGAGTCPFCPGNERMTPPEVRAIRPPSSRANTSGWSVRTIPNQFAVLRIEGKFDRRGEGLYDMMNGIGAHEVVIETPEHSALFSDYPAEKIQEVLWMLRERVQDLLKDSRFRYIQVFRNYGNVSGATVSHPHSQIVALPILPSAVGEEIAHAHEYWTLKERCLFCDIINQDTNSRRLVYENDGFVVLEPFASKFPFETWIYPKEHLWVFHMMPDSGLPLLADALKVTMGAIAQALGNPAYNLIFHSAPMQLEKKYHNLRAQVQDYYHWHIEVIPRATGGAGFEYGTGFYINSVLPEDAAEYLRTVVAELRGVELDTGP